MALFPRIKKYALGVLRYFPKTRQKIRNIYWDYRAKSLDALFASTNTQTNTVVFESFMGRSYSCSPRALYEAMIKDSRFDNFEFIWSFEAGRIDGYQSYPELQRATFVVRESKEYFNALARAKFWVTNSRVAEYLHPKSDQIYIQCWHGTPLKRLGYDIEIETTNALNTTTELASRYGIEADKWTYLISPSAYTTEHLSTAFGLNPEKAKDTVLEIGYPRNDVIVNSCTSAAYNDIKEEILRKWGITAKKRLLLYAPTWRDSDFKAGIGYVQDVLIDFDYLHQTISDEWFILFRPHYFVANEFDFSKYPDFIFNAADVPDINELYIIADALLTDYSSVFFDYACTKRPLLFYMPDLEEYQNDVRGFYLDPIKDLPGPHCETTEEVAAAMNNLDRYFDDYGKQYENFHNTFCPLEDGHAAERLADVVFERATE